MKYIGGIITSYIVLLVLDIMQRRNHKRTQSLKKFTVRTITDVSIVCAVGAIFVIGAMVFALIDEPEVFKKNTFSGLTAEDRLKRIIQAEAERESA